MSLTHAYPRRYMIFSIIFLSEASCSMHGVRFLGQLYVSGWDARGYPHIRLRTWDLWFLSLRGNSSHRVQGIGTDRETLTCSRTQLQTCHTWVSIISIFFLSLFVSSFVNGITTLPTIIHYPPLIQPPLPPRHIEIMQ